MAAPIAACRHGRRFPTRSRRRRNTVPRFRAAAVYLNLGQLIPEDRVAEAMADLFGAARFCPMSLTQWVAAKSPQLAAPAQTPLKSRARQHRPGQNLLIRLHRHRDDVLRFLVDFTVPFTNNLAEQALRMMKVKMKISGAFRTLAAAFAALRSLLATARKRGWNILATLTQNPYDLRNAIV